MHLLLELRIATLCFSAGIYCTKNRTSQCSSVKPQWCSMIWKKKKWEVWGGWLRFSLFGWAISGSSGILITRVTPAVLKTLRGSLTSCSTFWSSRKVSATRLLSYLAHKCLESELPTVYLFNKLLSGSILTKWIRISEDVVKDTCGFTPPPRCLTARCGRCCLKNDFSSAKLKCMYFSKDLAQDEHIEQLLPINDSSPPLGSFVVVAVVVVIF